MSQADEKATSMIQNLGGGYQGGQDDSFSAARAIVDMLAALVTASTKLQGVRLASLRALTGSDETLYTATKDTQIGGLMVTNNTAGAIPMRLHHVKRGGSADQENALYYDLSIAANATVQAFPNGGIQMSAGETLIVRSGTGGTLAYNLYGTNR
jgi:hypothetical protein